MAGRRGLQSSTPGWAGDLTPNCPNDPQRSCPAEGRAPGRVWRCQVWPEPASPVHPSAPHRGAVLGAEQNTHMTPRRAWKPLASKGRLEGAWTLLASEGGPGHCQPEQGGLDTASLGRGAWTLPAWAGGPRHCRPGQGGLDTASLGKGAWTLPTWTGDPGHYRPGQGRFRGLP